MRKKIFKKNIAYNIIYKMEEFKIISDFPNYKISNFGRIYSEKTKKFLKPISSDSWGYHLVILCYKNKKKTYRIHRLVAVHFLENPCNYKCVDHKDNNK